MPARPEREEAAELPTDAARDLGDVWRFGLETSHAMAERVLELYRDLPAGGRGTGGDTDTELRRLRIDLERAVDLSVDVFDRVLALVGRLDPADRDAPPADDTHLVLRGRPGDAAHGTLWVHNRSEADQPAPALCCTALTSFDGAVIAAEHARVDATHEPIAAWNSRAATLTVAVPAATPPGSYHGLVLTDDADVSFRVRVDVSDVLVDFPQPVDGM